MTRRSGRSPRNYFGIPHAPAARSVAPVYHDSLDAAERATGALRLEINALSPVHVGCGAFELRGDGLSKEPVRRGGLLLIPGASIKGMCRQIFEAITDSGSPFERSEHHRAGRSGAPAPPLSAAAAVFGTLGLQGRVSFDDATPAEGVEPAEVLQPGPIRLSVAYQPQKAVGRRFYGPLPAGADQPAKVPALAIPANTVLHTTLRFRNLTRRELGLLLISLGVDRFTPRLGGGKYDDFGWVRFRVTGYRLRPRGLAGGGSWESDPEAVAAFVVECQRQVSLAGAGKAALELLTEKLQCPGARAEERGQT